MSKILFPPLLSALLLTGCLIETDRHDRVLVQQPTVTVSAQEAQTGEYIEVRVRTTLRLDHRSRLTEKVSDIDLAVCLAPDWLDNSDGATEAWDNCDDPELFGAEAYFQPSADFSLPDGQTTHLRTNLTVPRGETVDIEHTFSIASERIGAVKLYGVFFAYADPFWGSNVVCVAECGLVTWE